MHVITSPEIILSHTNVLLLFPILCFHFCHINNTLCYASTVYDGQSATSALEKRVVSRGQKTRNADTLLQLLLYLINR